MQVNRWELSAATNWLLSEEQERARKLAALKLHVSMLELTEQSLNSSNSETAGKSFQRLMSLGDVVGRATANSKQLASLFPALTQI